MEWYHILGIVIGNWVVIFPLWSWEKSESNADRREAAAQRDDDRREILGIIKSIQEEMKDFHERLCSIEERNRK